MKKRRAVITGLGPVSSIGIGKEKFWENAREGRGYFRNTDFPDVELEQYRSRVCSPVDNFKLVDYIEEHKKFKRTGRATQFTLVAAYLAIQDAGFKVHPTPERSIGNPQHYYIEGIDPFRAGAIIGQSVSNVDIEYAGYRKFLPERGPRKVNIHTLPQSNPNAGESMVSEWFHLKGIGLTITTACASATHAIGVAAAHIMYGMEDIVITGGGEAVVDSYVFSGFDIIKALSRRNDDPMSASRPFDKDRDGFVLGEGAGIIVVEELQHALKRGAKPYAEIIGFGFTQDAYNIVAPDPTGSAAIRAIENALDMAEISREEVEYINAHGTSTILNDPNESYIIKQVFGDYAYRIPISSSKSYFGHPLGAAGGLETIVTVLIMEHSIIAPTANLYNPDVEYVDQAVPHLDKRCDLDYVPLKPREARVEIAINESFGFGGQNAVLVLKKFE